MKISTGNMLKGIVVEIKEGTSMGVVVIDIGNGNRVSSVNTLDSIKRLGLKVGSEAYALFKATSVLIAIDD